MTYLYCKFSVSILWFYEKQSEIIINLTVNDLAHSLSPWKELELIVQWSITYSLVHEEEELFVWAMISSYFSMIIFEDGRYEL